MEIRDRSGAQNLMADHLSRIKRASEDLPIGDDFLVAICTFYIVFLLPSPLLGLLIL